MIIMLTDQDEVEQDPAALAQRMISQGYAIKEIRERGAGGWRTLWLDVDEVLVERVINQQKVDQQLNVWERRAVVARAIERGLPLAPIFISQGWKHGRYNPQHEETAA